MPKLTKTQKVGAGLGIFGLITAIVAATRAKAAPREYHCPYCGATFPTLTELQEHVATEHPGERIPIDIIWD